MDSSRPSPFVPPQRQNHPVPRPPLRPALLPGSVDSSRQEENHAGQRLAPIAQQLTSVTTVVQQFPPKSPPPPYQQLHIPERSRLTTRALAHLEAISQIEDERSLTPDWPLRWPAAQQHQASEKQSSSPEWPPRRATAQQYQASEKQAVPPTRKSLPWNQQKETSNQKSKPFSQRAKPPTQPRKPSSQQPRSSDRQAKRTHKYSKPSLLPLREKPRIRAKNTAIYRDEHSESAYIRSSSIGSSSSSHTATESNTASTHISNSERSNLERFEDNVNNYSIDLPLSDAKQSQAKSEVTLSKYNYHAQLKHFGYTSVVDCSFSASLSTKHPLLTSAKHLGLSTTAAWRNAGVPLLASIPRAILEALVSGTLSEKVAHKDPDIWCYYDSQGDDVEAMDDWAARVIDPFAPVIYVRELVDDLGSTLTYNELRLLIKALRNYVSGDRRFDQDNAAIDSQQFPDIEAIQAGRHQYLRGSQERARIVLTFCHALEQEVDRICRPGALEGNGPFHTPLRYIGYAKSFASRQQSHEAGSTNWLQNLVKVICSNLFRHPESNLPIYSMQAHVVCYLTSLEECRVGEEIFARAGKAYYYNGTGFNIAPAGMQVMSADLSELRHGTALQHWKNCEEIRERSDYYDSNLELELNEYLPRYKTTKNPTVDLSHEQEEADRATKKRELKRIYDDILLLQRRETAIREQFEQHLESLRVEQRLLQGPYPEALRPLLNVLHDYDQQTIDSSEQFFAQHCQPINIADHLPQGLLQILGSDEPVSSSRGRQPDRHLHGPEL